MIKLEKKYDELESSWSPAVRLYVDYFFYYKYKRLIQLP